MPSAAESREHDAVTEASLNGIYVKARELDRGHNEHDAPAFLPAGSTGADAETHASAYAGPDAETGASPDSETHASTHASDG